MSNTIDNSSPESKPSKAIKQSGFGLKQKLRSGYTKRFGSMINSKNANTSEEEFIEESASTPISKPDSKDLESSGSKLSQLNSSSQLNINSANAASFYKLRRNNSRTNSRSNSLVNSLYLHNINTGLYNTENNGNSVSTPVNAVNTMSGFTTPKMGPMTPTYPYQTHRYQNSVSSFSSFDLDSSQGSSNNIELTNDFINIFKQEYENHCMNPKITPFDQSNPPPGVVDIVYQKSMSICKKNKLYVCKINKNNLNLDSNHKLFNILKHIITESLAFNNRRNISRANSVTSFQLDTSYNRGSSTMLSCIGSNIEDVASKGLLNFSSGKEGSCKASTPGDETFMIDDSVSDSPGKSTIHNTPIKSPKDENKKKNTFTNPILFSPRKLKRDSKHIESDEESNDEDIDILVGQIHQPQFLKSMLLERNNINTNFKYSSEKDSSDRSSTESTDDTNGNERHNVIELKQAPFITKKSI